MKKKIFFLLFVCLFITGEGYVIWKYFFPQYRIEVMSDTSHILPHELSSLLFQVRGNQGEIVKNFGITHEKIMHLILVRKDLQGFQHLHPIFHEDTGNFETNLMVASNGTYRLFSDFALRMRDGNLSLVTLPFDVTIGKENEYIPFPVFPDEVFQKSIEDGYSVTLLKPEVMKANISVRYSLEVKKDGTTVMDFEPYLGTLGHSVILKKDTLDFIHTHAKSSTPESGHLSHHVTAKTSDDTKISFMTFFPSSGLYKIFVQFQHEGKVRTVDFVVEVRKE